MSSALGASSSDKPLKEQIETLRAELREAKSSRTEIVRKLKNVRRQSARLRKAAGKLAEKDLVALLIEKRAAAASQADGEKGQSQTKKRAASQADGEKGQSQKKKRAASEAAGTEAGVSSSAAAA
jgi:hypothetical protein